MRLVAFLLLSIPVLAQVTITDTLRSPTGGNFTGRVEVTANCAITYNGQTFTRWQRSYTVGTSGAFSASLIPTDPNASPQCQMPGYTARYFPTLGTPWTPSMVSYSERWVVPSVTGPLTVAQIRPPQPTENDKCWTFINATGWNITPCPPSSQYKQVPFGSSTTWLIPASTHLYQTDVLAVETFDTLATRFEPGKITIATDGTITIQMSAPRSGYARVYKSNRSHRLTLTNSTTASATSASHTLRGISWIVCRYADGSLFESAPALTPEIIGNSISTAMTISFNFPIPVTGRCDLMGE